MISTNLDSKFDSSNQKITELPQKYSSKLYPSLAGKINFYQEQIIFSQDGREFGFKVNACVALPEGSRPRAAEGRLSRIVGDKGTREFNNHSRRKFEKLFSMMDGTNSIEKLQQRFFSPSTRSNEFHCTDLG